ncbi:MAG: tRNA pseudouridine(38-40) synthase TruA, partial [Chloroflexota bacterium]|nr:tRNA pseudouridine(38-40) synthase TruA [Chloroflexota bacterium]
SKFSGKVEKNKSTFRTIFRSTWDCENETLVYEVEGNAFLPHQVRRMVGALVDLGRERLTLKDIQDMLIGVGKARSNSIPAKGLCLEKIIYEKELDIASVN